MNNQIPYLGNMMYGNNNQDFPHDNNFNDLKLERINNRINRLERQIRIIENRLNIIQGGNPTFLKNNQDIDDNMYML